MYISYPNRKNKGKISIMKKVIFFLCVCACLLCACGKTADSAPTPTEIPEEQRSTGEFSPTDKNIQELKYPMAGLNRINAAQ